MKEFTELLNIVDRLLGPGGCPWDREQTLASLREALLEESCEVIEAVDLKNSKHILEELGDLFFLMLFLCRMAEQEKHGSMEEVLRLAAEKLVRRHPHVFGDEEINTAEETIEMWNRVKSQEPGKKHRKSRLDGIPKGLPALARAQEILKKSRKSDYQHTQPEEEDPEKKLGLQILELVEQAANQSIEAEQALRAVLAEREQTFRTWEGMSC